MTTRLIRVALVASTVATFTYVRPLLAEPAKRADTGESICPKNGKGIERKEDNSIFGDNVGSLEWAVREGNPLPFDMLCALKKTVENRAPNDPTLQSSAARILALHYLKQKNWGEIKKLLQHTTPVVAAACTELNNVILAGLKMPYEIFEKLLKLLNPPHADEVRYQTAKTLAVYYCIIGNTTAIDLLRKSDDELIMRGARDGILNLKIAGIQSGAFLKNDTYFCIRANGDFVIDFFREYNRATKTPK